MYKCLIILGFTYIDLKPISEKDDRYVFLESIDYTNTHLVNERVKLINELSKDKLGILTTYDKRLFARLSKNKDILLVYPFKENKDHFLNELKDQGVDEAIIKKLDINWERDISDLENSSAMKRPLRKDDTILDVIKV